MTVSSMSTKSTHGQMSYVSSVTGGSSIPIYLASTQEDFPSQPYAQTPTPRSTRTFARNASIVLIGIRGTGKTSLALIASTAISRKVVESDRFFHHITGMTRGEHRKRFGPVKHHQAQLEILTKVLKTYDEGYIIVCSVGLVEKSGQALLKEYSKTHPIVHITRDAESLQEYLKTWDRERLNSLLGLSGSFFRSCSNYEFYNLTHRVESPSPMGVQGDEIDDDEVTPGQKSLAPFLTLKKAEDEFSNFLGVILGGVHSSLDSKYPLSRVPTEKKSYTYMVSVQLLALLDRSADIQEIETGADAIEIVVDLSSLSKTDDLNPHVADSISRAVSLVRRNTIVPIVYTVIPESCRHGSDWDDASRSRYLELLHHGLRLAPEYITVDLSLNRTVADILRAKGSTNVIGYYAFASRPSMGWDSPLCTEMYDRANNMGCQVARICMASESSRDIFATEAFRSKILASPGARIPLIAYEIGEQGKTSSCFNQILTPVLPRSLALAQRSYASEESAAAIYDYMPCLTSQEATRALYACFILDPMRFYNFGASITYSLSPAMHNAAYQVLGMPHTYQIYQATSLDELEGLVRQADFGGAAISLPWKVDVIPRLHSLSRNAKAIGAVNTVIPIRFLPLDDDVVPDQLQLLSERNRAGPVKALHGDNTDWIGIWTVVRRGLSPVNAVRPQTTALILGAGGIARAGIYGLIQLGVRHIFISNRTLSHAENLARHYNEAAVESLQNSRDLESAISSTSRTTVHVIESICDPWPEGFRQPTIIVSCIPAHSIGGAPAANITLPDQWFKSPTGGVVIDMAYKPQVTPLLKQVRAEVHRGWVTVDGLELLPEQGFAQFELFTGRRAPRRLMRQEVLRNYRDEEE